MSVPARPLPNRCNPDRPLASDPRHGASPQDDLAEDTDTTPSKDDSFGNSLRDLLKQQRHKEADQKPYRVRMSWAWYTGKCGYCDRPVDPKERVTLCQVPAEGWKSALGPFPVCSACMEIAPEQRQIRFEVYGRSDRPLVQVPCEACARPIIIRLDSDCFHVTCGEPCHSRIVRHRARPAPQACAFCGEAFPPSRPEQAFCSLRCEQEAFRDRHRAGETLSAPLVLP
ncbi:MAG TPA: hypothetical protein VFA07_20270 [Chthonomonadaceae bacterium]|nr:hypothetical protein [Chthonomonadaceae bacterium]